LESSYYKVAAQLLSNRLDALFGRITLLGRGEAPGVKLRLRKIILAQISSLQSSFPVFEVELRLRINNFRNNKNWNPAITRSKLSFSPTVGRFVGEESMLGRGEAPGVKLRLRKIILAQISSLQSSFTVLEVKLN